MIKRRRPLRRPAASAGGSLPPEANPALRAAILEIVDKQLQSGEPPEAQQSLERMVDAGYTREGARQMIAYVVVREIFPLMARGERYDVARYRAALARLPVLPDDESSATVASE